MLHITTKIFKMYNNTHHYSSIYAHSYKTIINLVIKNLLNIIVQNMINKIDIILFYI